MHNADLVTDTNNRVICDISMDIFFVCQNSSVQCPQENNRYLSIPKLKFRIFCLFYTAVAGWMVRKKEDLCWYFEIFFAVAREVFCSLKVIYVCYILSLRKVFIVFFFLHVLFHYIERFSITYYFSVRR